MKNILLVLITLSLFWPHNVRAAVGCTLSNPSEDLKYLFPEMTTFREELRNFQTLDAGKDLYGQLKVRLGSDLDAIYETFETPYTLYLVYRGEALIGIVHGVNVPGEGGVIQVFLSVDPASGEILNFFFQRIESPVSKELRSKDFREQFRGLTLADFYKHDYFKNLPAGSELDRISSIKAPRISADGQFDYDASIRGVRKNLILLDMFFYNHKFEPFYIRAQQALSKTGKNRE